MAIIDVENVLCTYEETDEPIELIETEGDGGVY